MTDKRAGPASESVVVKKVRVDDDEHSIAYTGDAVQPVDSDASSNHGSESEHSDSDDEAELVDDAAVYTYTTPDERYKGQCVEVYANGDVFIGSVVDGVKCGPGTFRYVGGSILRAEFVDDMPSGEARLYPTGADNEVIVGEYNDEGQIQGRQYLDGDIVFEGLFNEDQYAAGLGTFYLLGGGRLTGIVDEDTQEVLGEATYMYPCGYRGLRGEWGEGAQMLHARFVELSQRWDPTAFQYSQTYTDEYRPNVSTETKISREPLREEPWETDRVVVKHSAVKGANEGLFIKRDLSAGMVVSFYSGVRLTHTTVDGRSWELNNNTITLNDDVVIDVPSPYDKMTHYRNTLGHKANHSANPNAKYDVFFHPVFGDIKCIRSTRDLKAGEEVFVDYGYSHDTVPDWYRAIQP